MSGTISIETLSEGPGPKYKRVADAIRRAVERGDRTQGDKLPPVRDLAWTLKITPGTVARAYGLLTDQRILTAEIGRGTFVANPEEPFFKHLRCFRIRNKFFNHKTLKASLEEY